jgi:tetratricopeptide (TPR) repeat protein
VRAWLAACLFVVAAVSAPATNARHAVPTAPAAIAPAPQTSSAQPPARPASAATPADPAAAGAASPEDLASTAAFVDAYYTALNARDLDAVIRLWSREMPSRGPMVETLDRMMKAVYPSWSDVRVATARVDGDRARVVIRFTMSYQPPPGASVAGASSPFARRTMFVLAREQGEWRLFEEKTVEQELAERLLALNDDAAAMALAASELAAQGPDAGAGVEIAVIRALVALGGNAASRQRHDEALRAFGTARQMVERVKVAPGGEFARTLESLRAQTLSQEAFVYIYRPRPDMARALTLLEQALSLYEGNGDKSGTGEALLGMATAAYTVSDYARALTLYERAQTIHTELHDTPSIVRELIGIGNVRYLFAQFDDARRVYREGLSEAEALGMTGDVTRALQGLGRVYVATGDYARGREQYLAALKLIEASGARAEEATALLEIGRVELVRGDLDAARARYESALAIEQQAAHAFGEGRAYYALALIDVLHADYDAAIKIYTSSIEAYERGGNAEGAGEALLGRASAWLERQNLKPAIADFTDGLAIFERLKHVEGMARANLGLAMAQVTGRNMAAALGHADRAVELADRAVMPDIRWQARFEAGRALLLNGDAEQARVAFEEAVETIERERLDAATDARTPARRSAPYAALVEWQIAHGDASRALLVADDEKRRVLEDLLQPFRLRLARGLTVDRVAEEQRLIGQRVSLLAQIRREVERGAAGEARTTALQQALRTARDASAEWDAAVAREAPRTPYLRGESRLSSLDALAAALPADSALIHFVSSDDHLSVIVATPRAAPRAADTPAETRAETTAGRHVETTAATAAGTAATEPAPSLDVRAYSIDISRRALAERVAQFTDRIATGPVPAAVSDKPGTMQADAEPAAAPPAAPVVAPRAPAAQGTAAAASPRATEASRLNGSRTSTRARSAATPERDQLPVTLAPATAAQAPAPAAPLDAESLFDLLLGPARAQIEGRRQLVIVPDDALWTLPFEALRPSPDRYLVQQAAITCLPSVAAWLANPLDPRRVASAAVASGAAAERATSERMTTEHTTTEHTTTERTTAVSTTIDSTSTVRSADAEISDVSPLQSTLTLADDDSVVAATAPLAAVPLTAAPDESSDAARTASPESLARSASDWLSRSVNGDLAIVSLVTRSSAQLRLDVGRLGGVALAWALSTAGLPKTLLARRELEPDARELAARAVTDAIGKTMPGGDAAQAVRAVMDAVRAEPATSDPHDWAVWQLIGPPSLVGPPSPVRVTPPVH